MSQMRSADVGDHDQRRGGGGGGERRETVGKES